MTGPSSRSLAEKPVAAGRSSVRPENFNNGLLENGAGNAGAIFDVVRPVPVFSGQPQCVGNQDIAVRGVVDVGDMRFGGRVPFHAARPSLRNSSSVPVKDQISSKSAGLPASTDSNSP